MLTVLEVLQKTTDFFAARGVESARLNAELLVGHALGLKRMALYLQFERVLSEPELEKIRPFVRRRGQREPLQYILGEVEFCGLSLKVDRRALIPRPETEYLVELAVERAKAETRTILDLGTGTGALALALANRYPEAAVLAVDLSRDALALAAENAELTGLAGRIEWREGSWFEPVPADRRFDLIVANPPYLTAEETAAAAPEVRQHEPVSALEAADDGMADLKLILEAAPRHLAAGGLLALETGIAQHRALLEHAGRFGYAGSESKTDLTGRDRYLFLRAAEG
jgi:release factor glutamine methyltransferase